MAQAVWEVILDHILSAWEDSGIDTIQDFSTAQSDKLNLSDILDAAFDPLTHAIADFVSFVNDGNGNSEMYLDRDGTAATYTDEQIALLTGLTDLSAATLYSGGYIIAEV